jgi:hypothetical protein
LEGENVVEETRLEVCVRVCVCVCVCECDIGIVKQGLYVDEYIVCCLMFVNILLNILFCNILNNIYSNIYFSFLY